MCVLAHVLEAAGLSTVAISSVRPVAERMHPPRVLHGEFPLGRPLGRPGDPAYQHRVLAAAFSLLDRPSGPVLEDFPETIVADPEDDSAAIACALPPRFDPDIPAAVDEAQGYRQAWARSRARRGHTSVGRTIPPERIGEAVGAFVRIAEGTPWQEAGLPADPIQSAHDVRTYYEEAALEITGAPAAPGAIERWYYESTAAGRTVLEARRIMKDAGAPFPLWFYMAPGDRN